MNNAWAACFWLFGWISCCFIPVSLKFCNLVQQFFWCLQNFFCHKKELLWNASLMCVRVREGVSLHMESECPFLPKWDRDCPPKWCIFFEEYSHFHKGARKPSPHPFKRRVWGGMAQGRNTGHAKSAYSSKNIHFLANLGVMGFAVLGVFPYSSRNTPIWPGRPQRTANRGP